MENEFLQFWDQHFIGVSIMLFSGMILLAQAMVSIAGIFCALIGMVLDR